MKIKANVVQNITGTIERIPFRSQTIKQTQKQYEIADTIPVKAESCNLNLLVGSDYYADISSIDIEANKTVFIFIFFYETYFKCKKHKQNPLSNIQPNIFKQKNTNKSI